MQRAFLVSVRILAILALVVTTVHEANAALKHRYSFTSNANDSIGGMNGTIVDAGLGPNFSFSGGQLDLSANTGEPSNAIVEDAYVDLPNGMISSAVTSGTNGAISVELWATLADTHTWQRFFDFGSSNDGENTSNSGAGTDYFYIAANSGRFTNGLATEVHNGTAPLNEVGLTGPFPNGVQSHVVGVYNHTDTSLGPDGTYSLYLNGMLVASKAMAAAPDLRTFVNNNNWIGRSQWPDPVFDGMYNEFRIYDHALSATEVAFNGALGPDQVASVPVDGILSIEVNTVTNSVKLINNTDIALGINYYEITSAGGALSTAGWNSLDDKEAGDAPGVGWDESGGANANQLIELYLAAAGDSLPAHASVSLGNAFNKGVFGSGINGDLNFKFGLTSGSLIAGGVKYVTTAGVPGDYNSDGVVNAADYTVWRDHLNQAFQLSNEGPDTPGQVTLADYTFWKSQFGNHGAGGLAPQSGSVPEPTTLALLLLAIVMVTIRNCRSGRRYLTGAAN
jgi:Concanavalin A-like lectin/glucanases superfamily